MHESNWKNKIMEAQQILQSDILDILFEGKNKLYGAYDLRKTYNKRIKTALASIFLLILATLISSFIINKFKKEHETHPFQFTETTVREIPKDESKPISLPKRTAPAHVATIRVSIPVIIKDHLVVKPPADIKEIEKARIDLNTTLGKEDIGAVNPPSNVTGTSVVEKPVSRKSKEDSVFLVVQIEASFPGGMQVWQLYIRKAITAQLDEFADSDYGTCIVNFIVDKYGKVSNVYAKTMVGTKLAEIAVKTIKNGPNWIPAVQNGNYVNAYRSQPVTLLNPNE